MAETWAARNWKVNSDRGREVVVFRRWFDGGCGGGARKTGEGRP